MIGSFGGDLMKEENDEDFGEPRGAYGNEATMI